MKTSLDFVKAYLSFGWSLIPIIPETKRPPEKWGIYQEQRATLEKIQEWLEKKYYLAVVTGGISGVCVVDDDRGKHGLPEWGFESPVVSKTTSGGKHYYFKYDRELHSHTNLDLHVDFKAWHSYCLLPPFNGREWISKPSQNLSKIVPVTDEAVRLINSDKKEKSGENREPLVMSDFINIPDGARTDSLHRIACSIFSKTNKEDGLQILLGINQTYSPPLDQNEFEHQVSSAYNFVSQSHKTDSKHIPERTPEVFYSKLSDFTNTKIRPRLLTGSGKLDKIFDFPSGYYVIIANPGAGKGWFALWLAKKFYLHNGKKSVYFSLEMSEMTIRNRILQAWSNLTQEQFETKLPTTRAEELMKKDILVVYPFGQTDELYQTPENFENDLERFYSMGYRIFCFDHLHELMGANNNDTNQGVTEKWSKCFRDICKRHEDIWLFIYAQPNGAAAQKKIIRREDIAGSKAITQKADCVISLNRPVEIDQETHEIKVDTENRDVVIWIDKNRQGTTDKIGTKIYFSKTGNFVDYKEDEENDTPTYYSEPTQKPDYDTTTTNSLKPFLKGASYGE